MDGFVHGMTAAGLLMTVDASMIWCVMVDYTVERPEARPDYTRPCIPRLTGPKLLLHMHETLPQLPINADLAPNLAQLAFPLPSPLPGFSGIPL